MRVFQYSFVLCVIFVSDGTLERRQSVDTRVHGTTMHQGLYCEGTQACVNCLSILFKVMKVVHYAVGQDFKGK